MEPASQPPVRVGGSLRGLVLYFLKLGAIGFGGPAALVGYMRKDLVEERKTLDEATYNLSLALAQIMPGPLAAQTAIAIGYFQGGIVGATLGGFAFILPSFLMVLGLSWLYVTYGGLAWMQALFYGIGAVVIAIIAIAAYRLARGANKRDPVLWAIFGVMLVVTVMSQAELAVLFLLAGLIAVFVRAWPGVARAGVLAAAFAGGGAAPWGGGGGLLRPGRPCFPRPARREPRPSGGWRRSCCAPARRAETSTSWCRFCSSSPRRAPSSSAAGWPSCPSYSRGWSTTSAG